MDWARATCRELRQSDVRQAHGGGVARTGAARTRSYLRTGPRSSVRQTLSRLEKCLRSSRRDLGYATSIRVARGLDTMPPAGLAAGRERLAFVAEVLVGYQVEVTVRFASRAEPARAIREKSPRSLRFFFAPARLIRRPIQPRRSPLRSLRAQLKSGDVTRACSTPPPRPTPRYARLPPVSVFSYPRDANATTDETNARVSRHAFVRGFSLKKKRE